MIDVAVDYYPTGQEFNVPWKFWVIDSFLSQDLYNNLLKLKDSNNYELVDKSDGKKVTNKNTIASKHHIRIRNYSSFSTLFLKLDLECQNKLSQCIDIKNLISWNEQTNFIFDLVRCEPKYAYQKHVDHIDKKISIVVYLHPSNADGTVLFDKNNQGYNVTWKPNRAFIFVTDSKSFHFYNNTTNQPRYSLNVYAVDGNWEFKVSKPVESA